MSREHLKFENTTYNLAFCETDQNEVSLWLKRTSMGLEKIYLIQRKNEFSFPIDRYLFLI